MPLRPNQCWFLDFLTATFGALRKFRILAVKDDCCRENLDQIADTCISGAKVGRDSDALVTILRRLACIVSENGTNFISKEIQKRVNENEAKRHDMDLGTQQYQAMCPPLVQGTWRGTTSKASTAACARNA